MSTGGMHLEQGAEVDSSWPTKLERRLDSPAGKRLDRTRLPFSQPSLDGVDYSASHGTVLSTVMWPENYSQDFEGRGFVVQSRSISTSSGTYLVAKRCLDIVGSLFAIALFSPLMLLAVAMIKLCDRGPVFYVHRRVGEMGREFTCLKFRTMRVDADQLLEQLLAKNQHSDNRTFKMQDDPRITWFGKWLRKASMDELPQLFNVLLGQMSLVGPRPPVPSEVAKYSTYDLQRLEVKPGLTCIWQVSGRSRLPFPEQLELDIQYIQRRSLWLDIKLLFLTIPAVLTADGAC